MSKKKLLSESQVRRFMGLAGLSPINENYMDENMYEAEEEMAEKDPMMEAEEEMPETDMEKEEPEMEAGDVDAEVDEDKLMKGLQGLKDGLEVLEDIASAAGLEGGEEPEMDMDDGAEMEDDDMDAELGDVDMEATEEEEIEMQEQIVNEVARRVAKRIVEAKRAHKKMNEALGRKK